MDQERFDRITRTLASGQSRRGLLKTLTGTAMGGVLAAAGLGAASAKGPCKAPNHKCGKGKNAVCCTSSQICTDGACTTPPPPDPCAEADCAAFDSACSVGVCSGGTCSAQATNESGACTTVNNQAGTCTAGGCAENCTTCGDVCTFLSSDEANCGACGVACAEGEACLDGDCFLAFPNCGDRSYGVAANGGGINACICGDGTGAPCATTGDCADGEVCIVFGSGFCRVGCQAG